jgi:hypothetical protein
LPLPEAPRKSFIGRTPEAKALVLLHFDLSLHSTLKDARKVQGM